MTAWILGNPFAMTSDIVGSRAKAFVRLTQKHPATTFAALERLRPGKAIKKKRPHKARNAPQARAGVRWLSCSRNFTSLFAQ
jgi:hypothetical protein